MKVITVTVLYCVVLYLSSSVPPNFPTDGDMLDYLVQIGEISEPDGLFATWFHRANSKEEMNKALAREPTHTHLHTTLVLVVEVWHKTFFTHCV